jgi:hypothetical protein
MSFISSTLAGLGIKALRKKKMNRRELSSERHMKIGYSVCTVPSLKPIEIKPTFGVNIRS